MKKSQEVQKPLCVIDCNKHMIGANKKDQMLQMYLTERNRMNKQYMKCDSVECNDNIQKKYRQKGGLSEI
jgi:hypothetical protein